jgi:hypothetical protein
MRLSFTMVAPPLFLFSSVLWCGTELRSVAIAMEPPMSLVEEADRATEMLSGKIVTNVRRHRSSEVLLEFADGTRLFVDRAEAGVELSITGGNTA